MDSMDELLLARNPDAASTLPYLLLVPLGDGLVFRVKDTWPRTTAVYCHPVARSEWPQEPELVERIALRALARRGAAIDVVADRGREQRSQIVFTRARGRDVVFWQSPRTRKQARPDVRLPTARAAGVAGLEILADAHERYPYRFSAQQATVVKRALPCGDYGVAHGGTLVASVERKSMPDLASSVTSGRLRFALGELAALPRAAVIVEDRYAAIFALTQVRPAVIADAVAELQVRWPNVPIVFAENRRMAEEWTYRFLAAAYAWADSEAPALAAIGLGPSPETATGPAAPEATTAEVRAWARANGLQVPDRGRLRPEVHAVYARSRAPLEE